MPAGKILVVDDDPFVTSFLHDTLVETGYAVITAPDALGGIRIAQTEAVAFILMDHKMPGMTGLDAVRQFRADPVIGPRPRAENGIPSGALPQSSNGRPAAGVDSRYH